MVHCDEHLALTGIHHRVVLGEEERRGEERREGRREGKGRGGEKRGGKEKEGKGEHIFQHLYY